MILQDVFGNLIGSLNGHLALQKESHKNGRGIILMILRSFFLIRKFFNYIEIFFSIHIGFIIAKIFYCLLEWLMIIPPNLFTDTELCQLVFDAIELAFELSNVSKLIY